MKSQKFKAGETILTEGEDGDTAFLIVDGCVEVIVGEGNAAKTVGTLNAGEVFGEMSLIEPGPRSATVKAVSETECIVTNYDEFIASLQENPERAVEFMKTLVHRLRLMNERITSMRPGRRGFRAFFNEMEDAVDPAKKDEQRVDLLFWPMV